MTCTGLRALVSGALISLAIALVASPALAGGKLYRCDDLATRAKYSGFGVSVYQGDDGWFFREGDLNHLYLVSNETMRFLTRLRDVLQLHGITLVLLPLPPKAILEPQHALAAAADGAVMYEPDYAREEFEGLLEQMREKGIGVVDVLRFIDAAAAPAPSDYYFARDIHWRPALAKLSAMAVATYLVSDLKLQVAGETEYLTKLVGEVGLESNANTYLNQLCSGSVPVETLDVYDTVTANQSVDSFLVSEEQVSAPVDIVGTSFTDEAKPFNFAGFLREQLKSDVATYSISGGNVDQSIYKWAYEGLADTSGAKVLLWELPYVARLEQVVPLLERQVLPAIAGDCTAVGEALATTEYSAAPGVSSTLAVDATLGVGGDDFYLSATLSDPSVRSFVVHFTYADGYEDVLPIVVPDRVPSVRTIFAELPPDTTANLISVLLENGGKAPISGTMSLCAYPGNVGWKSASTM